MLCDPLGELCSFQKSPPKPTKHRCKHRCLESSVEAGSCLSGQIKAHFICHGADKANLGPQRWREELRAGAQGPLEVMDSEFRAILLRPLGLHRIQLTSGFQKDFRHLRAPSTFILSPPHNEKLIHGPCKLFRPFTEYKKQSEKSYFGLCLRDTKNFPPPK